MQKKNPMKAVIGGLAVLATTAGLLASTMTGASADPTRPYAATGSDTTQDVWNGLTNDFGAVAPSIASWDAFAGTDTGSQIKTKTGGNWFVRPAGSGNGQKSVSAVWDSAYTAHDWPTGSGVTLNHEDVDFARSSSGPTAGTGLKFLPFGRDAMSVAYNTTGGLTGLNLTTGQITELYSGVDNAADSVVTFSAQPATVGTTVSVNGVAVHPKIPQSGSGTRAFFLSAIGVSGSGQPALAPYISDPGGTAQGGLPENDGSVLTNDGDLICFSAAQWIAQANGKQANTTAGLALANINGQAPTTGSSPTMSAGALFGAKNVSGDYNVVPGTGVGVFNRDVYNVIPTSFIAGTSKQQALVSILASSGGIYGAGGKSVIKAFGFGTLSYATVSANWLDGAWKH